MTLSKIPPSLEKKYEITIGPGYIIKTRQNTSYESKKNMNYSSIDCSLNDKQNYSFLFGPSTPSTRVGLLATNGIF